MYTLLLIASLMSLMALFLTPIPKLLAQKAVATFSFARVYVFSTMTAIFCFSLLGLSTLAYAQDPTTEGGLIQYVLENFFTAKEAGVVALSLLIAKVILFAFNTPKLGSLLDKLTGKMKLVVTFLLTYVVGVLTVMIAKKVALPVALFDSANIPLLGLFLNQIYKQFIVKASEPAKIS